MEKLFFCKKGQLEQGYQKSLHSKSLENSDEKPGVWAKKWWDLPGLNQRPSDYESPALTTELRSHDSSNITSLSEISRRLIKKKDFPRKKSP